MRKIVEDPEAARRVGKRAMGFILRERTHEMAARVAKRAIQELWDKKDPIRAWKELRKKVEPGAVVGG
jgi:hypothetical protein